MQHAQFVNIPPLEDIQELFKATTGLPFQVNVSWSQWHTPDTDDLLIFRPYIRPCHQKLLLETVSGVQPNACSFIRQLLRPYGFSIIKKKNLYSLTEIKETTTVVGKKGCVTVVWDSVA